MTTLTTTEQSKIFGYEDTREGKLKFFKEIALWQLQDWFTKPLDSYVDGMTDDEMIDFVDNKLLDAYEAETDYRYDETDQDYLYDIDHVVQFDIKNTPKNLKNLTDDSTGVYAFHHSGEEDWDHLDKDIIWIEILNEWDSWILSREEYSERMIENFCSFHGIDEDDVISKVVSING